MLYHNRKNLKCNVKAKAKVKNVKVKLDLTKKLYSIFIEAMELLKNNEVVEFVIADINCRLKVVFKDG